MKEEKKQAVVDVPKKIFMTTEKSNRSIEIWENTFTTYGPAGIGKSTFWAQDKFYFADCERTLGGLQVFRTVIDSWETFCFFCAEFVEGNHNFLGLVIDPIERLYKFCQVYTMQKYQIDHPSDMDWGKGWSMLFDEFLRPIIKLQVSKFALIMISHESEVEIKTRSKNYTMKKPNLPGSGPNSAYSTVRDISDYIMYMTLADDDKTRVLKLAPSENWVAKKRHKEMPDEIKLPQEPELGYPYFEKIWNESLKGEQHGISVG